MRLLIAVTLIAILSAITEYFLPWWMIAVVSFVVSFIVVLRPGKAFLSGFLGIAIFWTVAAIWRDIPNEHILSTRIAAVFHLPNYPSFICATAIVGGLAGGLSAWAGALLKPRSV